MIKYERIVSVCLSPSVELVICQKTKVELTPVEVSLFNSVVLVNLLPVTSGEKAVDDMVGVVALAN